MSDATLMALDVQLEPFTTKAALARGVTKSGLARSLRDGHVRRMLRGVYVDATVADDPQVRAAALRLIVGTGRVVVGRTAAWVRGSQVVHGDPVETRPRRALPANDIEEVEGLLTTTALRTALDVARELRSPEALAFLDESLRRGQVHHLELAASSSRFAGQAGVVQLRGLVARADARALDAAESVLRLRWYDADLPTPVPHPPVAPELVLAVTSARFGVAFSPRARTGWRIHVMDPARVLEADADLVEHHLERAYRAHLLRVS